MKQQTRFNFIKAEQENIRQDRNYYRLISDCLGAVKFLESLPMSVLEDCIKVFRTNLWSHTERRKTPQLIQKILEAEKENELQERTRSDAQDKSEIFLERLEARQPILGMLEKELGSMKAVSEDVY
mmetsp:Transcript_7812/g.7275  ORF Transcript_7812/g.7275 Transcript_7812/m.7275 type:complete len:126 (-) Transcript_7812:708-1085(-)